ncbi:hypothetical protein COY62_02860 [bacterium (Candidatus Howlettbacteria) CG_4_10_14_0_8_um_filter_40_9]|nr:MAG: hypothetical protein COY62_02860 [bacterium (Candidatus Howlettbacteria) CG_4_10_14_0_8_um_filter_40_9]
MNSKKVIQELKEKYPEKDIVVNPQEIVCEVDPENGKAIAIIDNSKPHFHKYTTEIYKVLKGELTILIDDKPVTLLQG